MDGTSVISSERIKVFENALQAMVRFRQAFGRGLSDANVAEYYVARALNLQLVSPVNAKGYDLLDTSGIRYQVKCRNATALNVDINNFGFDYLVLVNLDNDYQVAGMWRISVADLRTLCSAREDFRKYQVTQARLKQHAQRIDCQ
jgi:hypothetical protein